MKLVVQVMGARDLPAMDLNGLSDPYVKVKLGKQKFKTKVVKKTLNPYWGEEFAFRVDDLSDELLISVLDEDKYFNDDFVGCVKFPVSQVFDSHNKCLDTCWHPLQPKSKKPKHKDCGEILLNISFITNNAFSDSASEGDHFRRDSDVGAESPSRSFVSETASPQRGKLDDKEEKEKSLAQKSLAGRLVQMFNKNPDVPAISSTHSSKTDLTELVDIAEATSEDHSASVPFDELMKTMQSREQPAETPENLPGGVLLDQMYVTEPKHLNTLIFSPDSTFPKALADVHGTTELEQGPWKFENDCLKRVVTYVKAASKLVKACKATEDQQYLKADGKVFAVLASVSTPDVPYGKTFRTELLFCITPGPELPSGEQCTRFVISWRMNFLQSTMMKGMIENGARQGLKDSYEQYATLLSQNVKPADSKDLGSNKDQVLASLQAEPQSDWKLAVQYFANFTVVSTFFIGFYMMVHIWLATPSTIQGLEFVGLDLPDSLGEFIVCGVLALQGERVLGLISRFMQARVQKGSDHGVKARGDGWLLTVALIEGSNIAAVDSTGFSDPYVVFSCNGKTRTSSIKFQKCDPMWNEIFEFDAMDEPPSVLDVEIYDFDGPFDEATSLGHAEINFVKTNISDLADLWIPLQGKLAQACQSKLHLRIFLNNTRGGNVVNHFINKMEKEVGKKITVRSPQTNSAFQKLFGLPPEEFLINDFTCHLKRKMPLQGRLFLSARIIGFHANLFGRKTKFFFLWEDIEDIHIVPPTLSSMGSPTIVMTLRQGRGMDARHGAKTQDEEGRLKFHFQSFVSFNVANRTIMALWKARSLSPEQKVQIIEEESEVKSLQTDESGSFLGLDDVSMSEVHSSSHAVPANFFVELFGGGDLDRRVMEKAGCLNYSHTPWESEKGDVYVRQIYYRYDKRVSQYRGEVTSTQQKYPTISSFLQHSSFSIHFRVFNIMAAQGARDKTPIGHIEIPISFPLATDQIRLPQLPEEDDSFDYSERTQWIRAAVLGANDGLVSVASLMMGVGAVKQDVKAMLLAGFAGLVAGACSMAIGEFVSVYTQYDIEISQMKREVMKGNGGSASEEEAKKKKLPNPAQAAIASAIAFSIGAVVPLLGAAFIGQHNVRMLVVALLASIALVVFGGIGARMGRTPMINSCVRVLIGGWMAMAITFGLTKLIGSAGLDM